MLDVTCLSLKTSIELFFLPIFVFLGYSRSAGPRFDRIVSGAVISLPSRFSMKYSSCCIDVSTLSSMLVSPLRSSLLDTYSLSTSSLGCHALFMVISFLVLWSIILSSSLVHFKNCPEYLRRQPRYLSLSQGSCNRFMYRVIFWLLWDTVFKFFSFISRCLMVSASNISKYFKASFSPSVLITWFGSSTHSVICGLPLFISSMVHFSMQKSISISWLYILIVCVGVSNAFSFLEKVWCRPNTSGGWSFLAIYWVSIRMCIS